MENEPEKPPSSVPPPPDLPPPPPPSETPRKPDVPPPPPMSPPPPKPAEEKQGPAKPVSHDEDDGPKPGSEAAFDARVVAAIIDCFVAAGLYMVVGKMSGTLGFLVWIAYFLGRDALPFLEGQSIGKRIMKIKAVTLEGKGLSGDWQSSAVRNISMAIPFFGLVEAFVLYSRKDKDVPLRRLGDEWAKTKVIVVAEPSAF